MKKAILVSLMTLLAITVLTVLLPLISATESLDITVNEVEFNGITIADETGPLSVSVAGESGEVVPISVRFTANESADDVEISAWMQGRRSDAVEDEFRDLIEGKDYIARLNLKLPTDIDPEEKLTLYIRIETDAGNWEESYTIAMQRKPYTAEILFVEVDNTVEAGSSVPIEIVIKNLGRHELEDLVVSTSIPELAISKKAYFGDLTPTDVCEDDDDDEDDCDKEDATERKIYLSIPTKINSGVYELVVEASNSDTRSVVKRKIEIVGAEGASKVFVAVPTKEISIGEVATYTLTIVNSGNKIGIYEIIPETVEGVIVSVEKPIVSVKAGESETIDLKVKAGSREGTYSFAVNVNSENKIVERAVMNAKVVKGTIVRSNITILTIVLAIIFVVLLIVLIVLLTRRPMRKEELEESYY